MMLFRLMTTVGFIGAGAVCAMAAANDFEVAGVSNVPGISVGKKFQRGDVLKIPAGGSVTLTDRTGGSIRTKTCAGKYEGPVESCKATSPGGGVGTGGTRDVPGGTRGMRAN